MNVLNRGKNSVKDSQIRDMVSYVVKYLNKCCPENLDTMVHLIGHEENYRKRVEQITEEILDNHDSLFVDCSNGKKIEDITPAFAEKCEKIRKKMMKLVEEYISDHP